MAWHPEELIEEKGPRKFLLKPLSCLIGHTDNSGADSIYRGRNLGVNTGRKNCSVDVLRDGIQQLVSLVISHKSCHPDTQLGYPL